MDEAGREWVVLRELGDMFQLQSDCAMLEAEGIAAEVISMADSMYPSMSRYRLMVPADREAFAMDILRKSQGDE